MNLSTQLKKWRGAGKDGRHGRGGKSQAEAAKELRVPLKTYIKWESGERQPQGLAKQTLLERIRQ